MPIYFANNADLDFGGLTDLEKPMARIGGFTPLKKREREASISHSHVYCVDVSFVPLSLVVD